jgi:periplasmic divalent cation tolerance protein
MIKAMHQVLMCTCPDQLSAKNVAKTIVTEGLAACVNIIPSISSMYLWQGELVTDDEHLLIIKSTAQKFDAINAAIEKVHPYEVPEVVALDIQQGNQDYLNWITNTVQ